TDADSTSAPKVAVINQTFVDKYLPNVNPLGHHITLESGQKEKVPAYTVVGVSANNKYTSVNERERPMAFVPYTQVPGISTMQIVLRTQGNPMDLLPEARRAVQEFGPDLPLLQPITLREQFDESFSQQRIVSRLAMFFGLLAVLLVATGLYGNLAYRV